MIDVKLEDLTLRQISSNSKLAKEAITFLIDSIAQECYTSGLQMGFDKGKEYGVGMTRAYVIGGNE